MEEERTCDRCPYVIPTEAEQEQLAKWGLPYGEHICDLYKRIVRHKEGSRSIMPCYECVGAPFEEVLRDEQRSDMPVLQ